MSLIPLRWLSRDSHTAATVAPHVHAGLRAVVVRAGCGKKLRPLLVIALALLVGCNAGPNYVRPKLEVSDAFSRWPSTEPATAPSSETVVATGEAPLRDLAHWWEVLHDDELNSLLSRAVKRNIDLRVAIARLQQ